MSGLTLTERSTKLLYPPGEAWRGLDDGVMLELIKGTSLQVERDRLSGVKIKDDFFPDTTTLLDEWEYVFRLPNGSSLTTAQRIARIKAAFNKTCPATYSHTNEIYALSGFNVVARPLLPSEDPRVIASSGDTVREATAVYGDIVYGDAVYGEYVEIPGTADVVIFTNGRPGAVSLNYLSVYGDDRYGDFVYGDFLGSKILFPDVTIPDDSEYWPLIYVLEAPDGDFAQVPIELKDAFEFLTFKIKPLFMWALGRIAYV